MLRLQPTFLILILLVSAWINQSCWGAENRLSERLLPANTVGYVAADNLTLLREAWEKTQLGQLLDDPVMEPFIEDLREQADRNWSSAGTGLGLTWQDLYDMASGEVSYATVRMPETRRARILLVDAAGREEKVRETLARATERLNEQGAKTSSTKLQNAEITLHDLPPKNTKVRQIITCHYQDVLLVSDDQPLLQETLARLESAEATGNLGSLAPYQAVMARCQQDAGEKSPEARWYLEPFGLAEIRRAAGRNPWSDKYDFLAILGNQGFKAIQGLGGYVFLSTGQHEVLHRTFVYAPGNRESQEKYDLAARMLKFPNISDLSPYFWVPRELASYLSFSVDVDNAFESSKTLINEMTRIDEEDDQDFFEDTLENIRTMPNGPGLDIRRDFVGLLGDRVTVVRDNVLPVSTESERILVATVTTDMEGLAKTIEKQMKTDPLAIPHEIAGHRVWEIVSEEDPEWDEEPEPRFGGLRSLEEEEDPYEEDEEFAGLPSSAVTVAHGQLFICTHLDFLRWILEQSGQNKELEASVEYQIVMDELARLRSGPKSFQRFARTDETMRPTYELIKMGKLPESKSMFGRLLNGILGEEEGVTREQKIDGSKLPDYQVVRRYLGPSGIAATSEEDGWYIVGFTLRK